MVDGQQKPIAGGVVRQAGNGPMPTRAITAQDGHFQLAGVLEGPAVLFAEKDGFRFHLQPIDDKVEKIKIMLTKTDEVSPSRYQMLGSARPVEEERAMSRRLMQPCADTILAKGTDQDKDQFLLNAIEVDRSAVLEWVGTVKFNDADYLSSIKLKLVEALARDSLDEATALIETSSDATIRGSRLCGNLRGPARPRSGAPQGIGRPGDAQRRRPPAARPLARIDVPAKLADRLIDSGEIEQARKLLQEAEHSFKEMTKNASRPGYVLGQVANVLARIDLPAALAILDDLERTARKSESRDRTNIFDRFIGTIAYNLATQSPADAERVLNRLSLRLPTVRHVAAVCIKMAPMDLARARRIADSRISPDAPAYRPYTLGLMAQAIAATTEGRSDSLDRRRISRAGRPCRRLASRSRDLIPSRWQRVYSPSSSRWNRSDWLSASVARSRLSAGKRRSNRSR